MEPCDNEEVALPSVIDGFRRSLPTALIIVADNACDDGTAKVARRYGAAVVNGAARECRAVRRLFERVLAAWSSSSPMTPRRPSRRCTRRAHRGLRASLHPFSSFAFPSAPVVWRRRSFRCPLRPVPPEIRQGPDVSQLDRGAETFIAAVLSRTSGGLLERRRSPRRDHLQVAVAACERQLLVGLSRATDHKWGMEEPDGVRLTQTAANRLHR